MSAFGDKADNTRGSKRGPHGRIVLIHIGSFNDHICRLLSAPAWHPASGRYPALTSRQVSCQDRPDTTFHFSGRSAVAAAPFFSETWLWRVSAVVFALPMLSLLLTYPHRRRKAVGKGPPPIVFAVFVVLGSVATLAMLAWILAGLSHQPAVYISALFINFFTLAFAFIKALDVIMQEPADSRRGD